VLFLVLSLGCSGLVVSTCEIIGSRDTSDEMEEINTTKTGLKSVFYLLFVVSLPLLHAPI